MTWYRLRSWFTHTHIGNDQGTSQQTQHILASLTHRPSFSFSPAIHLHYVFNSRIKDRHSGWSNFSYPTSSDHADHSNKHYALCILNTMPIRIFSLKGRIIDHCYSIHSTISRFRDCSNIAAPENTVQVTFQNLTVVLFPSLPPNAWFFFNLQSIKRGKGVWMSDTCPCIMLIDGLWRDPIMQSIWSHRNSVCVRAPVTQNICNSVQ